MDRKELLLTYIENNVVPILVDFISGSDLGNAIIMKEKIFYLRNGIKNLLLKKIVKY